MSAIARLPRLRPPFLFGRRAKANSAPRPAPAIGGYVHNSWARRHRTLLFVGLVLFAILYGFAFAITAQVFLVPLTTPLVVLLGILLWVAPDIERVPERWLARLLTAFLFALLCWPDYIAIALPGLPWITAVRLTSYPMTLILLICLAMSAGFRARLADILSAAPWIWRAMLAFVVIQFLSIFLSSSVGSSISRFVIAQTTWTAAFLAACYVFTEPGRARRFGYYLWIIAIFVCLIGVWEARNSRLPWAGHIPSFLKIEDPRVQYVLGGISRAASGVYRVQSKFGISLGLGEYLGVATPFILHILFTTRRLPVRLAAAVTIPLIFYITIKTDSRLATIGFFASILLYGLFWSVLHWRRDRSSIMAAATTFAYPAGLLGFFALSLVWRRLGNMIWGGGAQAASTDSRREQYARGFDLLLHNPIGHGIGEGAKTLGYIAPGGDMLTIDTYYLAIALEYGVIGFVVYYGMFLWAAWLSARTALTTRDGEVLLLGPACIAFVNFLISKSVFSQQENHPLIFMLLGLLVALLWRERERPGHNIRNG